MYRLKLYLLLLIPHTIFAQTPEIDVQSVADGFVLPVSVTNAGDGSNRLFVTQQGGSIKIVENGVHLDTPFLDISALVSAGGEMGLLGLAFHPDYETNGFFYVNYTDVNGDTVVDRFSVSLNDANIADADSRQQVLSFDQPFGNHNGGDLSFGPHDGMLYISSGDGGDAAEAQNLNSLLGNILRIDINGDDFPADNDRNYAIPADNPYVGAAGADEIWVSGLRNPWRFSHDRLNGDLYIGDVGEDSFEEFNYLQATMSGLDFGWPCYEGDTVVSTNGCGVLDDYTFPFLSLAHSDQGPGPGPCSAVGGYVYRGSAYPNLNGWYFSTDWCSGEFYASQMSGNGEWLTHALGVFVGGFGLTSFGESESGEIYMVAFGELFLMVGEDVIFENGFESL